MLVRLQMVLGAVVFGVGALGGGYFYARVSAELGPALMGATIAAPCVLLFWFARRACYVELSPSRALGGAMLYMPLLLSSIWVLRRLKLLSPFFAFAAMGVSALLASAELLWRLNPRLGRDPPGPCLRGVSRRHWNDGRSAFAGAASPWPP